MTNNPHFERPTFSEIKDVIRRTYSVNENRDFYLTPTSLHDCLQMAGIQLEWHKIPN